MKKKIAKLALNRETIRLLTKEHLNGVAGAQTAVCTTTSGEPTMPVNVCNFTHLTCTGCADC